MFDALRFWLRQGVDGFRVDVMWLMIKDDQFRDNPPNPGYQPWPTIQSSASCRSTTPIGLRFTTLVAEMRAVLDEFPDRVLIGEIYLPIQQLMGYYGADLQGRQSAVQFPIAAMCMECRSGGPGHL